MLSLSDNEFAVLNFLARNFTERLTIRNIAQKLKFSPAGVHTILKKLEKTGVVSGERLGTGLFYKINFDSKTAYHLAAVVLVGFYEHDIRGLERHSHEAKALLIDRKNALFITDNMSMKPKIQIEGFSVNMLTEDELIEAIRKREPDIIESIKNSSVVFGEEIVINIIKKFTERF